MTAALIAHAMPHDISTFGDYFAAVVATIVTLTLVALAMWVLIRAVIRWEGARQLGARRGSGNE
jgi:hypothetical protein